MAPPASHARNVLKLYKALFRLHRGLPLELRAIGDAYVRDEFKRHKDAEEAHARVFMQEWTRYALTLSKQVQDRSHAHEGGAQQFGVSLAKGDLDDFSGEQLAQLYELYQESSKPQPGQYQ